MAWQGSVVSIHIGERGMPLTLVDAVEARAGEGLVGDRYFVQAGTFSKKKGPDREITLIETEALEALQRDYGETLAPVESRRNIATRGVPLNHLVGRQFRLGEVVVQGIRLCEPCGHLQKVSGKEKVKDGLQHRGGLRAQILKSGVIREGDEVSLVPN
jgi:MOSC domain-containing protein YiiM